MNPFEHVKNLHTKKTEYRPNFLPKNSFLFNFYKLLAHKIAGPGHKNKKRQSSKSFEPEKTFWPWKDNSLGYGYIYIFPATGLKKISGWHKKSHNRDTSP